MLRNTQHQSLTHIKKKKMTREEHLKFCKICMNRKMNMQKGLICSLTNEKANFESQCLNYVIDEVEKNRAETKNKEELTNVEETGFFGSWKGALLLTVFGFIRAAIKGSDDIFGIIFFILGIGWLIIAIVGYYNKNKV